jgi:hypothetical protein
MDYALDCSILRSTIKEASKVIFGQQDMNKSEPILSVPDLGGVQVLPVMWRQKVKFGMKSAVDDIAVDNDTTLLEDITLDTVPSIRMLVSDVVLDGKCCSEKSLHFPNAC